MIRRSISQKQEASSEVILPEITALVQVLSSESSGREVDRMAGGTIVSIQADPSNSYLNARKVIQVLQGSLSGRVTHEGSKKSLGQLINGSYPLSLGETLS